MAEIGIITNPHSKLNKRNPQRYELLAYIVGSSGFCIQTQTLDELRLTARKFKERNIAILAINGGDGTISRTLTAFIQEYGTDPLPKIALLRGGTMNVVASNLKIHGSPEEILYRLVEKFSVNADLATHSLRMLKIDNQYGFIFGDGMVAEYLKLFYEKKTNALGAIIVVLKFYFSHFFNKNFAKNHIVDIPVSIQSEKKYFKLHNSLTNLCSTIPKLPLNVPMFSLVKSHLAEFQVVQFLMRSQSIYWLLPLSFLHSGAGYRLGKRSWLSSQLKLCYKTPNPYTIDGEIFSSNKNETTIELGPIVDMIIV